MIRFFLLRIVVPLLIFWLVRNFLRTLFASTHSKLAHQPRQSPAVHTGGELKRDPVCGTYVPIEGSLTKTFKGELVYFCSARCRDQYRQS